MSEQRDYSETGLNIQAAMVDLARRFPDKAKRPDHLIWNGLKVRTSDRLPVPERGLVKATFLSAASNVRQGFDLKVEGWLQLAGGERVPHLRTWMDERYEDTVSYPFYSRDGLIRFWNVYERRWPNGDVSEEKWAGNAGFWVERASDSRRIYHCSHGLVEVPDFELMVVELEVSV